MKTFYDQLWKIRKAHSSNKTDLGTAFEKMVKVFFENDKQYKSRFKEIQMWQKWSKHNNVNKHDDGIDLVGIERDGSLCAIQCKCLNDDDKIDKDVVNAVSGAAKVYNMKEKIIVFTCGVTSTCERFAEMHKVQLLSTETLRDRPIDWTNYPKIKQIPPKKLRKHQELAFADVVNGLNHANRGKMIMACGTGKTFTSLRIAEKLVPKNGTILYLVPSITLIQQTMREWSENSKTDMYYMAACSDKGVSDESELGSTTDVESRVSTDPNELKKLIGNVNGMTTVIFSTYHSIERVAKAVKGMTIDLIFCDEAHKTVGGAVKVGNSDKDTYYTFVHKDSNIKAKKRIYMTATPRVYTEAVKKSAEEKEITFYSMDDEKHFGKTLHQLSFADAVHKYETLVDYKVKIAVIPEEDLPAEAQKERADDGTIELNWDGKMVAAWDGIRKPEDGKGMLQRVIVFHHLIDESKTFTGQLFDNKLTKIGGFEKITSIINDEFGISETARARHVDGTTSARDRKKELHWLSESNDDPSECRLLSNAKCLSEGVDVPALDGVVFMNPRKSVVDVVQSVGRVMRRPVDGNKKYGYIIIPVVIPAGMNPEESMDDNKIWKVVWQVLNALRSHDPRLEMDINRLVLEKNVSRKKLTERVEVTPLGDTYTSSGDFLEKFYSKLVTKLIEKVGDINYFDEYGKEIGKAAATIEERISGSLATCEKTKKAVKTFNKSLKRVVSESIGEKETVQVISQHMVLSRVFDRLFEGRFKSENPVAIEFEKVVKKLDMPAVTADLENFYEQVDKEMDQITTREGRQSFIKKIYGNFFAAADKKGAKKHGVVYTPIECIDFIINSVEILLQNNFNKGLKTPGIKILEPFAGTGTFITRLLESGLIDKTLVEKYKNDISANELILLAHYVATINIETTYKSLAGNRYEPFPGMAYTDTLNINPRHLSRPDLSKKQANVDRDLPELDKRVKKQMGRKIDVIIGNPPYSAGQKSFDDDNANIKYDEVDDRIKATYLKGGAKGNVNSIYDSYIRSIRWMSDRISDCGVIGVITNGSFMRSDATAGMRAALAEEFDEIWCLDLNGNARTKGEERKKQGGNIFGLGSRAPVAITFLVKKSKSKTKMKKQAKIYYCDIGDYLTAPAKIAKLAGWVSIKGIDNWTEIEPDSHNDWLDQRNNDFYNYTPIGSKDVKSGKTTNAIFKTYSLGNKPARDIWVYNSSKIELEKNMKTHVKYYNEMNLKKIKIDKARGKWDPYLATYRKKGVKGKFSFKNIRSSLYRPFFKQYVYYDPIFTSSMYRIPTFLPKDNSKNLIISIPSKYKGNFSVIITDKIPDYQLNFNGQTFPLYTYNGAKMIDNILDNTLTLYRNFYNNKNISKDDIFYYVYGILHHTQYINKFNNSLIHDLPHIPMAPDFNTFSKIGKDLAKLHLNYETSKRFNITPKFKPNKFKILSWGRTKKLINGKNKTIIDKSIIRVDGKILYDKIPLTNYQVNGKSPLGWVIDRYQYTKDEETGIENDPCAGIDICEVIERAIYVEVESEKLINKLPDQFEPKNYVSKKQGLDAYTDKSSPENNNKNKLQNIAICPSCNNTVRGEIKIKKIFGFRKINGVLKRQSWCSMCRKSKKGGKDSGYQY